MRHLLWVSVLLIGSASAYESKCYLHDSNRNPNPLITEPACPPGPPAVRNRWIGFLDEHRRMFERSRVFAGLPEDVSQTVALRVFTGAEPYEGGDEPSLMPVPFHQAERVQVRYLTPGELAQLPDFSYALWDWAMGNETCPLPEVVTDAATCHDFRSHMGAVNSNHFLPQAQHFYAHLHGLAMGRAAECAAMQAQMGDAAPRFATYLKACEVEALTLEAVGHHFLQDAWSTGHMWVRWGSPDLEDFEDDAGQVDRSRAVLVAMSTGMIHGARGVLQDLADDIPFWAPYAGLDVNDALCAPRDGVDWRDGRDLVTRPGLGDDYLLSLQPQGDFADQHEQLYSCAMTALRDVYTASGQQHGALADHDPGLRLTDPQDALCFGQRVTNLAWFLGLGIDYTDRAGVEHHIAMDSETIARALFLGSWVFGGARLPRRVQNQWRNDMAGMIAEAELWAEFLPNHTQMAQGEMGPLVGVPTNDHFADKTPIASYVDPQLPWPATADPDLAQAGEKATALARVFHRAHVADWCAEIDGAGLESLRAHAEDPTLDADARAAACEACAEFAVRHLRVGENAGQYDAAAEPVCHYLSDDPAYIYQPARGQADTSSLARSWCGCGEALVLTRQGVARVSLADGAIAQLPVAGDPQGFIPAGDRPRAFATSGLQGGVAVVTNFGEDTVSLLSLVREQEAEIDIDDDPETTSPNAPDGVSRIEVGDAPRGVAVTHGGAYALVAISGTDEVVVIDLERRGICKRFDVGLDPEVIEVPDSIAISRDNTRAWVSLTGTPRAPGEQVAVLDMFAVLDCGALGDEVVEHWDDLGGDARPGDLALSPDGTRLAVAGRGNDRVMVLDAQTGMVIDLRPDDPARRFFRAADTPWSLGWASDGETLFFGHVGAPVNTRLAGSGTVRLGELATGRDAYDVGVTGAVRGLVVGPDDQWVYVGDVQGFLTPLSVDLWDGSAEHIQPPFDHTGGCLDDRGRAEPCPPGLAIGAEIRGLIAY